MDTESELHRKTLDQLAWLSARYDAGMLGAETFRVAVETIWNCMGGVVDSPEFQELMQAANAEVASLPASTHTRVFEKDGAIAVLMRTNEQVRILTAAGMKGSFTAFTLPEEAADHVAAAAKRVSDRGMREIPE